MIHLPANLPDLPRPITSFGAAVADGAVYVYGGHHGKAHHYYDEGQSGELLRLDLERPLHWETAARGPRLQGLAMVAWGGGLYRVGGFMARNGEDEEQNLLSVSEFARFDSAQGAWESLPPMPEPRSSFDAVVADDVLYVVGGWAMDGSRDAEWLATAYSVALGATRLEWRKLADPPFRRRALAVGAFKGVVYVIGGMEPDGSVGRETNCYDPSVGQWIEGPRLPGEDMDGFGAACATAGGALYLSTASGSILRLSADGAAWETAGRLREGRFFHRMLAADDGTLIIIGGASMQRGKFASVETVPNR